MTFSSNLTSLYDGSLRSRVQDALGNAGASATLTNGSVTITGTPTGEGLRTETAAPGKRTAFTASRDIVSLSPTARTALTNQEIGLKLLLTNNTGSEYTSTKSSRSTIQPTSVVSKPATTIDTSAVEITCQQKPTQVIGDLVAAGNDAFSSISTTQGFTAAAAADPAFLKTFTESLPDNLGVGFLAALKAGTLTVQTGTQAGYTDGSTTLTGTNQGGTSTSGRGNFDLSTTNVVTASFGGFGSLAFSWPKTSPSV